MKVRIQSLLAKNCLSSLTLVVLLSISWLTGGAEDAIKLTIAPEDTLSLKVIGRDTIPKGLGYSLSHKVVLEVKVDGRIILHGKEIARDSLLAVALGGVYVGKEVTPKSRWDGRCPECKDLNLKSTVTVRGMWTTLLASPPAWYDEEGEKHIPEDPNTTTIDYECSRGHFFSRWE